MKLKYFGTAAAEGIPAMFCTCAVCEKARALGGRNLMSRSQAQVDDTLLIDFPPDTFWHASQGLNLSAVTDLLLTHSHRDHLYAEDLNNRSPGYAHNRESGRRHEEPLRVYGTAAALFAVRQLDLENLRDNHIVELCPVEHFRPFSLRGYTVTALKADHDPLSGPALYLIAKDGQAMLYAHDTGVFPGETWDYLAQNRPQLGLVSIDCTGLASDWENTHMGLEANIRVRERLCSLGCTDENTVFCCHHFSHNGGMVREDFVPLAAKAGFLVSFDGMELCF